jgi:hypothetical protein
MNTKQKIMAEFWGVPQKTSQLGHFASQPTLTLGRSAQATPKIGIGLAGFWFGKKNQHHQHHK